MKDSILNINVSCFPNAWGVVPVDVSLLTWLKSDKYRAKIEQIRSLQDVSLQKEIKETLPCITPSGRFSYRSTEHLIEHTGFITFDIDADKNPGLTDFALVRDEVSHLLNVAYCGLSVRGAGCWGLIPIPQSTPQEHTRRFNALSKDFAALGIRLDSACSDITRLRFYSWDPDAYFNHHAAIYDRMLTEKPRSQYNRPPGGDTRDKVEALIARIKEQQIDITGDYKSEWFGLAASLANEFGEGGRGYFHALSQFHPDYSQRETDKQFDAVLNKHYNDWSIGTLFALAKNYGITLKNESSTVRTTIGINKTADSYDLKETIITRPDIWGVLELEQFFNSKDLPEGPIRLDNFTLIEDPVLFVQTELAIVKAHNGNERYLPYLERLKGLKSILN